MNKIFYYFVLLPVELYSYDYNVFFNYALTVHELKIK